MPRVQYLIMQDKIHRALMHLLHLRWQSVLVLRVGLQLIRGFGSSIPPGSPLLRRRKWFRDPCAPSGRLGPGPQPIIVADGVMGTIPPAAGAHAPYTTPHRPMGQQHAGAHAHPRPAPGSVRRRDPATLWHFPPVQPTEDNLAEAAVATTATQHPCWTGAAARAARPGFAALDQGKGRAAGGGGGGGGGSVQACDGTASEALAERHGDPISDGVLESVLRGRRRFLRAQQLADGELMAASDPRVSPVQVRRRVVGMVVDVQVGCKACYALGLGTVGS